MAFRYIMAFIFMGFFGALGVIIMTGELPDQIGNSEDSEVLLAAMKAGIADIGNIRAGVYALTAALIIPLFCLSHKRDEA